QTLNQLLVDLDGFSPTEGVIFIGATNFPELLDKALVRPGRFDRNVHVPLPDVRGRLDILKVHTKNVKLAQEVDLSILARGTPGFSGADLHNMVNQAAIQASRDGSQKVDLHHLEYAKDKILMGAERKSAVMTEEERRNTAYHEGGHALVAFHTRGALPLHKATIIPRGQSLGMVMQLPEMDKVSQSRQELKARMAVAMGGRVAEELIFGYDHVTGGASSDIQQATRVARGMVTALGMSDAVGPIDYTGDESDNILSASTKQLIEEEVKKLVDEATLCARNILESNTEQLHRLAQALLTRETLDAQEIISVMENKPLPPLLTDKRTAAAEDNPTVDPTDSERRSPPPDDDTPNATTTSPTPAPVSVPTTA
ncbi:i-AAA protease yme1, partial [Dispira parvispora]